jgi:hypothetical protein
MTSRSGWPRWAVTTTPPDCMPGGSPVDARRAKSGPGHLGQGGAIPRRDLIETGRFVLMANDRRSVAAPQWYSGSHMGYRCSAACNGGTSERWHRGREAR